MMTRRNRYRLKIAGLVMMGLAVASFALRMSVRVAEGRGTEVYWSGKGIHWNPIAALVVLSFIAIVLCCAIVLRRFRRTQLGR